MSSTRSIRRLCRAEGPARKRRPRGGSPAARPPGPTIRSAFLASTVAIAALALLAGCAAESELTREDPGFTAESLRQGGLAVLGVVQVDEVPQVRPPLIAGLEAVLRATRRDIPLVPASRVAAAMPDSAYRLFLLGYQMRGDPDSLWLAVAAGAARPLARYGVLARVESDAVRYGTRYLPQEEPYRQSGETEVHVTGRDARIAVDVYDLATRVAVFRGKFIGSSDVAPTFRPAAADTDSLAAPLPRRPIVTDAGTPRTPGPGENPAALGYPEAPPVSRAAEAAFVNFARALPGGEAPPPKPAGR